MCHLSSNPSTAMRGFVLELNLVNSLLRLAPETQKMNNGFEIFIYLQVILISLRDQKSGNLFYFHICVFCFTSHVNKFRFSRFRSIFSSAAKVALMKRF